MSTDSLTTALSAPLAPVTHVHLEPGPGTPETFSSGSVALISWHGKNQGPHSRFVWCKTIRSVILAGSHYLSGPHFSRTPCPARVTKVSWRLTEGKCLCALWSHPPRGQFLKPSTPLFLVRAIPPSWTPFPIPHGQLIIPEVQLRGYLLQAGLLPRQNCGQPVPCGEPHEGEDLFLDIFLYQLPTQGLALSRAQEMSNTPNASPFLPLGRSVLLDSCLVAQAGEHPSGVGRTQPQEAAHQVWSHTRPGTQLPLKPGWASAEGAGALSTLFTGGVSAGEVPAGPGSRVVGTEGLAYAGGQWYQEGPGVTGPWVGSSWTWTPKSSHGCVTLDKSPPHSGTQWPPL